MAASLSADRNAPAEGQKTDGGKGVSLLEALTAASECGCGRYYWSCGSGPQCVWGTKKLLFWCFPCLPHTWEDGGRAER